MPRSFGHISLLILIGTLLLLPSCSTEKDAALNVGYHNMTARYNGYFNARVIMEESLESYRAAANEDYTHILPVDLYPTKEDIPMIQEKYETALEKCEKVIFRHSMPSSATKNKDEENCRWIDDNWFVIGVIHYIRQDYLKAEEVLKFVQETHLYIDQERVHEARIWLAKTYIAMGNFPEAKRYLSFVESDMQAAESNTGKNKVKLSQREKERQKKQDKKDKKNGVKKKAPFPKELKDDYELTMAEFWIAQKDYKKAIEHLEKAILLVKKKKRKARYEFVLAQLYQITGNGDQAAYYFNRVVHSNAKYDMRFQAQINKALNATSGGETIRKELTKMLKDPKNEEFKDQIYYALAEMEFKAGNKEQAIQYYSLSAFYSVKNDRQKGISYMKLGDIYFNDLDYLKAQKYYDSCVQVLPEEYEGYDQVKGKADGLSDLVFHYETYVYEDSVQHIAAMSESEREKYLEKTLKQIKEDEKRRKEEEQRRLVDQQNRLKNSNTTAGSGSKWYFYNQKVSSNGFNEFRALWGQRVLEDNWRRSNKTSYSSDDPDNQDNPDSVAVVTETVDSLTVDVLRNSLPLTQSALDSSNNRLINSLYMLGIIYKEQLHEENEAIKYFTRITEHNIDHPKVLPAYYQLYLLFKKKGSSKAEEYKSKILNDYGDSEIAMILKDPEYLVKKQEKDKEDLNEYSQTLEDYRYHRYQNVIAKCNEIIATDSANEFINKYYLLKAFSIGKTQPGNSNAIRSPLEELYKSSPDSEEGLEAKMYLSKLDKGQPIVQSDSTNVNNQVQSPYIFDDKLEHYFIVVFPISEGNSNATKIKIANFNKEFFRSKQLTITDTQLDPNTQLLVIRVFPDLDQANNYKMAFNSTTARPTLGQIPTKFESFLINSKNFAKLFELKDLKAYQDFYKEKYQQ
ncbi:MAG: tetratricopeptide repeat protein [Crocinitomicaceae bacterium]|nr:tetratricopeptide repeat protein [Crocinitomicaceae bacterium]